MSNEAKADPQQPKQQQGQQDPTGSVKTSDTKSNPSQGKQGPSNPQDISKKNPSQDSDSAAQGSTETRRREATRFLSNSFGGERYRNKKRPGLSAGAF